MAEYVNQNDNFSTVKTRSNNRVHVWTMTDPDNFFLRYDVFLWIKENIGLNSWKLGHEGVIFKNEEDFMGFKLRWS